MILRSRSTPVNSIVQLQLTCSKLHVFKVHNLLSFDMYVQLKDHHHHQDSERIEQPRRPRVSAHPFLLPFPALSDLTARHPRTCSVTQT